MNTKNINKDNLIQYCVVFDKYDVYCNKWDGSLQIYIYLYKSNTLIYAYDVFKHKILYVSYHVDFSDLDVLRFIKNNTKLFLMTSKANGVENLMLPEDRNLTNNRYTFIEDLFDDVFVDNKYIINYCIDVLKKMHELVHVIEYEKSDIKHICKLYSEVYNCILYMRYNVKVKSYQELFESFISEMEYITYLLLDYVQLNDFCNFLSNNLLPAVKLLNIEIIFLLFRLDDVFIMSNNKQNRSITRILQSVDIEYPIIYSKRLVIKSDFDDINKIFSYKQDNKYICLCDNFIDKYGISDLWL